MRRNRGGKYYDMGGERPAEEISDMLAKSVELTRKKKSIANRWLENIG